MAGGPDGLEYDPLAVGSYSQLLFSDDVDDLDEDGCFSLTSAFSSENPPNMLCFGDFGEEYDFGLEKIAPKTVQKTGAVTCSDSSSARSTSANNNNTKNTHCLSKTKKKRNVPGTAAREQGLKNHNSGGGTGGAPLGNQRNCKKTKSDNSSETRHAKAKKEKLGERILALQQLVSPFGKTDTASVLHEAMGYIRFLHDQVQVLCSPYLQRLPSSAHLQESGENGAGGEEVESQKDLRGKGLCLVPVQLTVHVSDDNGADFWSPAMVNSVSSNL